ncbi:MULTISPECIES: DUF554 domain-containing protein [Cyanophyceae]|uniref:DUF554 domain-containing protein n=1 Tax=Leptolyngbya subtilissima DQ-A4 TaxID=2933933 RepID=A0ABV0K819_9CYAN|nr:DUF554 domain-containing protein [Nodosilinea sp. FACHB-141]MBD2114751.1 DUF554 domain-containing protein [Nodosilinea sp. FACHB-141]
MLSLWAKTSGTWINVATILLGTTLGLMLRSRLPKPMQQIITQAVGLMTLVIGVSMASNLSDIDAGPIDGIILALLVMAAGGMLGEWWQIEKRLTVLGDWLKARVRGGGRFTEGFVAASLLFCIGPMAIVGSLNNGLSGDNALLTLKSTMDGLAAIALTGTYGVGVGFSALSVLGVQGALSVLASLLGAILTDPTTSPQVLLLTGTGGLMILGIGLNLLEIGQVRVASFLPALLLCPVAIALAQRL